MDSCHADQVARKQAWGWRHVHWLFSQWALGLAIAALGMLGERSFSCLLYIC